MISSADRQRVFFALWPSDAIRARLAALTKGLPREAGKPVPPNNLHLTLAFIGSVDADALGCLKGRARTIRARPFSLTLDQLGCFNRAGIMWVGPASCPPPLAALVAELNAKLADCGYTPEARPFKPHVTLLRKARPMAGWPKVEPIDWPVAAFTLVVSSTESTGARYQVLRQFELED